MTERKQKRETTGAGALLSFLPHAKANGRRHVHGDDGRKLGTRRSLMLRSSFAGAIQRMSESGDGDFILFAQLPRHGRAVSAGRPAENLAVEEALSISAPLAGQRQGEHLRL